MKPVYALLAISLLAACSSDDNSPATPEAPVAAPPPATAPTPASFEVTVTNLTVGQPLSPVAVAIHSDGEPLFQIGERASVGLETLAEGGDNSQLLEEAAAMTSTSGESPVAPGATDTLTLTLADDQTDATSLSLVTMLVNTNDAITGVNDISLTDLDIGESLTLAANAYDAGTEANSELPGTIPGPVDGGEGFNSERDDVVDVVSGHPGVVTADDGLPVSVLNQSNRFDNPVIRITISRTN